MMRVSIARRSPLVVLVVLVLATACGADGEADSAPAIDAGLPDGHGVTAPPEVDASDTSPCGLARANRSPLGCSFTIFAPRIDDTSPCAGMIVTNPGTTPVKPTLAAAGQALDFASHARRIEDTGAMLAPLADGTIGPGEAAYVALVDPEMAPYPPPCPFPAAGPSTAVVYPDQTGPAFTIEADAPIFVTAVTPYLVPYDLGAPGETMTAALRATSSWGTAYLDVGVFAPGKPPFVTDRYGSRRPTDRMRAFTAVAAREPTVISIQSGDVLETVRLEAGQAHRWVRDDNYIGATLSADKPIALFSGSPAALMPYDALDTDPVLSQIPPPEAWASEYAAAGHPPRAAVDPPLYRIVGASNDTVLTYDPAPPPGAPTTLGRFELAVFRTQTPFVVRSQDATHRFYMSVAMTGGDALCSERVPDPEGRGFFYAQCPGDPELVSLPPPTEFARRFTFATLPQFPDTYLVLTRKATEGSFADVTLDCAGVVDGWSPIDRARQYEVVTVPLSKGKFEPQRNANGACRLGVHTLSSGGLFTAQVWGWSHRGADDRNDPTNDGSYRSYGYAMYGVR